MSCWVNSTLPDRSYVSMPGLGDVVAWPPMIYYCQSRKQSSLAQSNPIGLLSSDLLVANRTMRVMHLEPLVQTEPCQQHPNLLKEKWTDFHRRPNNVELHCCRKNQRRHFLPQATWWLVFAVRFALSAGLIALMSYLFVFQSLGLVGPYYGFNHGSANEVDEEWNVFTNIPLIQPSWILK